MTESKKRLLIVDDNTDFARSLSRTLSENYEIKIVPTREAAYKEMDSTQYDRILTDLDLEEDGSRQEGLDVVSYARKSKQNASTPIVLNSAALSGDITKEAKSRGANATLKKPYKIDDLRKTLAENYERKGQD